MKKIISMLLALAMVFALCACGSTASAPAATEAPADGAAAEAPAADTAADSDVAYVQGKGTLIVGITDFEPMDYKNDSGEWIGFDADMAKAFASLSALRQSSLRSTGTTRSLSSTTRASTASGTA